ncbi:hypothetical protein RRG08_066912 [Elysia crispata]|uniref:Uncharacterized protein n=1 Tax=Elysia crispata TaxID=231223 RepID=A0AAE1ACA5_9GAST|nr:hypothetical protein RRG08_066912 [Elysia crispata]
MVPLRSWHAIRRLYTRSMSTLRSRHSIRGLDTRSYGTLRSRHSIRRLDHPVWHGTLRSRYVVRCLDTRSMVPLDLGTRYEGALDTQCMVPCRDLGTRYGAWIPGLWYLEISALDTVPGYPVYGTLRSRHPMRCLDTRSMNSLRSRHSIRCLRCTPVYGTP